MRYHCQMATRAPATPLKQTFLDFEQPIAELQTKIDELRFVHEGDPAATAAKIALPRAVAVVISAGLAILGVTPVEEMR